MQWNADEYARQARFVADLGMPVVELLAPRPGERILDLGCGDGALTERLSALGCEVVGVDASAEQVAAAQARGVDAHVADGHALAFVREFDAVFSNAALHWMQDPDRVIAGVWRALKPGGRFVGEFGGHGNIAHIRAALYAGLAHPGIDARPLDPWYFPTFDDYRSRLKQRGFTVVEITYFRRPTPLPGDLAGWLGVFAQSFLVALPAAERPAFLAEIQDALRPSLCSAEGTWSVDYVRLRFAAIKPGQI